MNKDTRTDDEIRRSTYLAAQNFFSWNSGKNTPNILLMLVEQIGALQKTIHESSKEASSEISTLRKTIDDSSRSSSDLARALNRITFWYAIITAIGVLCTGTQVYLAFKK